MNASRQRVPDGIRHSRDISRRHKLAVTAVAKYFRGAIRTVRRDDLGSACHRFHEYIPETFVIGRKHQHATGPNPGEWIVLVAYEANGIAKIVTRNEILHRILLDPLPDNQ